MCLRLDLRMSGLAKSLGFTYTRYADDLAFSYRAPEATGSSSHRTAPVGALLRGVAAIVKSEGFRVNPKKTTVQRRGGAQRVTGLVVNATGKTEAEVPRARVPRDVVRRLKAAIWNREHGRAGKGVEGEGESLAQLKGLAAFVHMADPRRGRAFLDRIEALEARERG
jgi:hypothetical protein